MAGILTIFGLCWLLVGVVVGLVLTKKRESYLQDLGSLETHEGLLKHYKNDWEYRWVKTCHAHTALFSIVCMIIGLILKSFNLASSGAAGAIVFLMISSVVLWTFSGFRSIKIAMGIADLMFVAGVLTTAYILAADTMF